MCSDLDITSYYYFRLKVTLKTKKITHESNLQYKIPRLFNDRKTLNYLLLTIVTIPTFLDSWTFLFLCSLRVWQRNPISFYAVFCVVHSILFDDLLCSTANIMCNLSYICQVFPYAIQPLFLLSVFSDTSSLDLFPKLEQGLGRYVIIFQMNQVEWKWITRKTLLLI